MSTNHLLSRLKNWPLFFLLFLFIGSLSTASTGFAACEYLSSGDFSSGSGWTANQDTASWTIHNGMLDVQAIKPNYASYAKHDFTPSSFFNLDTDISIVSTTGQYDAVGIQIYTSGDVYFSVNGGYMTNRIAGFYYPPNQVKFWVWDLTNEKWVFPLGVQTISGQVTSIGLSMVPDGIIMRLNRQDTNFKLSGDFSGAPATVTNVRLWATGTGLHARFDNICASSYEVADFPSGNAMPMPNTQQLLTPAAAGSPVISIDPAQANPFGFGPVASGGSILSLTAGISALSAPVDLYVGIRIGTEIYLFDANNNIHPLSTDGLIKWRSNTTGAINNVSLLPPGIDMSSIPGTYTFYFLITPPGRLDTYRLWAIPLVIGGGASVVTDKAMEQEIRRNIDFIFGITSGFSGGLTELTTIFSDKNVVTTSPATLDFSSILAGTPITIKANFGSGYTMKSGSVMSGSVQIVISNVKFSTQQGMGADFTGTFNNIKKDGAPFVNGKVSGNLLLKQRSDKKNNLSGQITFNDLNFNGQQQSGTIQISGVLDELDLSSLNKTTGTVRLTFANFISGVYTVNSGYVDIVSTQSGHANVTTNLQTSEGPVNLDMVLTTTQQGVVLNTSTPGTVGPYTVAINNVTLDKNSCANYPIGGTISFTKDGGHTGIITFTGACNGSYGYTER